MDMESVLARGAAIVAEIHHSHGIKAALAVKHLHEKFPDWTDAFWQDALVQARWFEQPVVERAVAGPAREIAPARAQVLLARSVVPLAYAAVRSWAAASGADAIVRCYLDQAAQNPQYLGHRLSVLLALGEAWPVYQSGPQRDLYLDRLAEFILACRFTAGNDGAQPTSSAGWAQACSAALPRPGFFGHNLICLAWIGRSRAVLSGPQLQGSLGWVVAAAETTFPDEEDNIRISPATDPDSSGPAFEAALRQLLLRGKRNIHLLTLADALAWLWDDLAHTARPYLLSVASHYVAP